MKHTAERNCEPAPRSSNGSRPEIGTALPPATGGGYTKANIHVLSGQGVGAGSDQSNVEDRGLSGPADGPGNEVLLEEATAGGFCRDEIPQEQSAQTWELVPGSEAEDPPTPSSPLWPRRLLWKTGHEAGEEDGTRGRQATPTKTEGSSRAEGDGTRPSPSAASSYMEGRSSRLRQRATARQRKGMVLDSEDGPSSVMGEGTGHQTPLGVGTISYTQRTTEEGPGDEQVYTKTEVEVLGQKTEPVCRREVRPRYCTYEGEWRVFRTWDIVDWVVVIRATRHGEDEELAIDERDIHSSTQKEDLLAFWEGNGGRDAAINFPQGGFAHQFETCEKVLGERSMFWVQWVGYREKEKVSGLAVGDLAGWWETEGRRKRKGRGSGVQRIQRKKARTSLE
jgi:hypothetical protein